MKNTAVQFGNADLPVVVKNALDASGLEPDRLELELTESVFIGDPATTQDMFLSLKKLGVKLALDDFGTGYSSLQYLRDLPANCLKLDRTFISLIEHSAADRAVIGTIAHPAHALGMRVVAGGV